MSILFISGSVKNINGLISTPNAAQLQLPNTFLRTDYASNSAGPEGSFLTVRLSVLLGDVTGEFSDGDSIYLSFPLYAGVHILTGISWTGTQTKLDFSNTPFTQNDSTTSYVNNLTARINYEVNIQIYDKDFTALLIDQIFRFTPRPNGTLFVDLGGIMVEYMELVQTNSQEFSFKFWESWAGSTLGALIPPVYPFSGAVGGSDNMIVNITGQNVADDFTPGLWVFAEFPGAGPPTGDYLIVSAVWADPNTHLEILVPFEAAGNGTVQRYENHENDGDTPQAILGRLQQFQNNGANMVDYLLRSSDVEPPDISPEAAEMLLNYSTLGVALDGHEEVVMIQYVDALVAAGIYARMDGEVIFPLGHINEINGRIDWKRGILGVTTGGVAPIDINGITFDGIDGARFSPGFTPSIDGVNYQLDDCSFHIIYSKLAGTGGFVLDTQDLLSKIELNPAGWRHLTNYAAQTFFNSGYIDAPVNLLYSVIAFDGSETNFRNGVSNQGQAFNPTALANTEFQIGARWNGDSPTTTTIKVIQFGGGSDYDIETYNDFVFAMLDAIGVPLPFPNNTKAEFGELGLLLTKFKNPLMWRGWGRKVSFIMDAEFVSRINALDVRVLERPANVNKQPAGAFTTKFENIDPAVKTAALENVEGFYSEVVIS